MHQLFHTLRHYDDDDDDAALRFSAVLKHFFIIN